MTNAEEPTWVWINKSRNGWKYSFAIDVEVFQLFGTILAVALLIASAFVDRLWIGSLVILGLGYIVGPVVGYFLLYYRIKCPSCGHNPTRRKADHKPMSPRILYPRLEKFTACPHCGDSGEGTNPS